jgi:hypothetical protein
MRGHAQTVVVIMLCQFAAPQLPTQKFTVVRKRTRTMNFVQHRKRDDGLQQAVTSDTTTPLSSTAAEHAL